MWAGEGGIYTNYMRDGTAVSFSIIISGGIWSKSSNYGMVVSSDSRIKKNIETINDGSSLDIINKIELNKFDYKDPLSYLQYKKTGFVAQEVKKVLPEAVSVHKNYIPDYLQEISEKLVKNENNKWEVSVNDITFDENYTGKCKFYVSNDGNTMKEIELQVETDKKTFIFDDYYEKVFLHSREVTDFHTLSQKVFLFITMRQYKN